MKSAGRVSLSSLATSVSALALLGASGVALGDPPQRQCYIGSACLTYFGEHDWYYPIEGSPYGGGNVYEDIGWCEFNPQGVCGCKGPVTMTNYAQYVWYDPPNYYFTWIPHDASYWAFIPQTTECWNY